MQQPRRVNVLVTGTPGTGKTTLARQVAEETGMRYIGVTDMVKEQQLYDDYDAERDAYVLDEDKVMRLGSLFFSSECHAALLQLLDALEDTMVEGFNIVDYHGCDFFPERWFALVLVLRTENSLLYSRLESRGYAAPKVQENVECEIMQVILDEARESYREEIVIELPSNTVEDMESNIARLCTWVRQNS
eukprot:TRINITY_DN5105_c0_g1_i2.p1 TRINITY_DN5105_c0_g1~~TRINITY_DN5105_c0_g1_i2.p1  ORF type:complete len:190 (-),score=28.65 TRINITY_DN5105_c0_g1_i2:28-597(-)